LTTYNQYALSIQVNLDGLSFCVLDKTKNAIVYLKSVPFEQKLTPFDTLNRLKTTLSSEPIFSNNFDLIHVIHQNELATIVPKELYDENHKAEYLKFNSKILKTDFITDDVLDTTNAIAVYVPYININNYLFDNFGAFEFKHASTLLVDTALKNAENSDKKSVYINVNKATIEVIVVEGTTLKLYNTFEFFTKEDFIYYILFVFEQLELDVETTVIKLSGYIKKDDPLYTILYTYVRHVEFVANTYSFDTSSHISADDLHQHYLILNSF